MKLIERELKGPELTFTLLLLLKGIEGKDFCYYETDPGWWRLRLYIRRN